MDTDNEVGNLQDKYYMRLFVVKEMLRFTLNFTRVLELNCE